MLILESGDKIRGDATNASQVDYTIYGLDNKILAHLADGQLPSSTGDLFTADSTDVITTVVLVNTGAGANTINLYHLPSGGTARRVIVKDLYLASKYSLHTDGKIVQIIDGSGRIISASEALPHASSHEAGGSDILYLPRTFIWLVPGNVAVGTEQGPTYRAKRAMTVESIDLHVKTAPTGAALIVDINEAGTTLFSTRPQINAGSTTESGTHVFSDTAIAAAAEVTMDVDQIGSTVVGADLTVQLHCKEAVI